MKIITPMSTPTVHRREVCATIARAGLVAVGLNFCPPFPRKTEALIDPFSFFVGMGVGCLVYGYFFGSEASASEPVRVIEKKKYRGPLLLPQYRPPLRYNVSSEIRDTAKKMPVWQQRDYPNRICCILENPEDHIVPLVLDLSVRDIQSGKRKMLSSVRVRLRAKKTDCYEIAPFIDLPNPETQRVEVKAYGHNVRSREISPTIWVMPEKTVKELSPEDSLLADRNSLQATLVSV